MSDNQMDEAMQRMASHRAESMKVDRSGWSNGQWVADARRLMGGADGSVTSLMNGHVMALLRRIDNLEDGLRRIDELAREGDESRFVASSNCRTILWLTGPLLDPRLAPRSSEEAR